MILRPPDRSITDTRFPFPTLFQSGCPDYKTRPVFRENDLRRHLINEVKADDPILTEDTKDDPRFSATAEDLEKKGVEDFQLEYAVKTNARLGGAAQVAAARSEEHTYELQSPIRISYARFCSKNK